MENEILKEAVEIACAGKMGTARLILEPGRWRVRWRESFDSRGRTSAVAFVRRM